MASGDYPAAFARLTEDLRAGYADAQAFADDFFATIDATTISSASLADAFGHGDHDDVIFDLETGSGPTGVLLALTDVSGTLEIFLFESV